MNSPQGTLVPEQDTKWMPKESIEQVKTSTTPSPLVKVELTLSQILSLNPPVQIVPFPETQTTQSKRTNQRMLDDYSWPGVYPPMVHQKDTADFLVHNKRSFCFNEQGTGKTASAIWAADYLLENKAIKRVLIVCPLSIMQSAWQADLFKFAVHRKVGVAYGDRNKRKAIINSDAEFVIINYDGVEIVADDISRGKFDLIIIDEANAYKTVTTNRWKIMNKLVTPTTGLWLMTGTPAAQSPTDAYGLAKLCVPNRVPRFFGAFRDKTMTNISQFRWIPKPNANEVVFDALQPAIRYIKKDCLDLPEVTHVFRDAPLTAQQEKYYKLLKKEMLMVAGGEEISAVNAAVNLNKLLQISGGAVYSDNGSVVEFDVSNRLKVIEEVINESSNKVLVFVPFTHTIELLRSHLKKAGISCEVINGSVTVNKRTEIFKKFQEANDIKVLIIQPQAASHGVTLTAADTIIWYAPVTSIETYLQANARIDRQGQKNKMTVVHIKGSPVETRMYGMLQNKLDVHTKIIDLYKKEVEENT